MDPNQNPYQSPQPDPVNQPQVQPQPQVYGPQVPPTQQQAVQPVAAQPMQPPTQPSVPQPIPNVPGHTSNTLAIIGLVLSILVPPVGLVISLIAKSKAKQTGQNTTTPLIGIILGAVLTLILAAIFILGVVSGLSSGTKNKAYDNERRIDVKFLGENVQKYVEQKGEFPNTLDDLKTLPGINQEDLTAALFDPKGSNYSYEATPSGCSNEDQTCTGYYIYAVLSTGEKVEAKNSITTTPPQ